MTSSTVREPSGRKVEALESTLTVLLAVGVGLVAGAVANAPIDRWPRGEALHGLHRVPCPACDARRGASDLLAPRSWIAPRRCRRCGVRGSPRAVVVTALTALLFGAIVWVRGTGVLVPALLVFTWGMVVAAAIDLEHRVIPNRLTLRLPLVLAVLVTGAAAVDGTWADLRRALVAAVAVPTVMLALSEIFRLLRGRPGIGMGDVKLALSIGLVVGYLGALELVVFAYATVLSAAAVTVVLVVTGRLTVSSRIPFGPYLAIGALLPVVAGDLVTDRVRGLLGL